MNSVQKLASELIFVCLLITNFVKIRITHCIVQGLAVQLNPHEEICMSTELAHFVMLDLLPTTIVCLIFLVYIAISTSQLLTL